jgi:hypothetical protein
MVVRDKVPRSNKHPVVGVGKVRKQALRQVEPVTLAARAAVHNLSDGTLAVRPDLDPLAAVVARVVLRRVQGDDKVRRLVAVAARPKPDVVERHLGIVEALAEAGGRGRRSGRRVRWRRLRDLDGDTGGRGITLRLPSFVSTCTVRQGEGDARGER